MTEPVFLLALAIAGGTFVLVARTIAGAILGRGASRGEIAALNERVEQQAEQIAELQERADFAERLLARGDKQK
jgi:hypothetical protein